MCMCVCVYILCKSGVSVRALPSCSIVNVSRVHVVADLHRKSTILRHTSVLEAGRMCAPALRM